MITETTETTETNAAIENSQCTQFDAYQVLSTVNFWIENCDIKATAWLGIIGIVITILFASDTYNIIKEKVRAMFSVWIGCHFIINSLLIISIVLFALGFFFLIYTISPRIIEAKKRNGVVEIESVLFYKSIADNNFQSYKEKVIQMRQNSDFPEVELLWQIHSASRICTKKFRNFKIGLWSSSIGIVIFTFVLIFCG